MCRVERRGNALPQRWRGQQQERSRLSTGDGRRAVGGLAIKIACIACPPGAERSCFNSDQLQIAWRSRRPVFLRIALENSTSCARQALPSTYTTNVSIDDSKDLRIAQLENELAISKAKYDALAEVMKGK